MHEKLEARAFISFNSPGRIFTLEFPFIKSILRGYFEIIIQIDRKCTHLDPVDVYSHMLNRNCQADDDARLRETLRRSATIPHHEEGERKPQD